MSLKQVDHFIYDSTSYTCYYDTGLNAGTVDVEGPNPHNPVPLPNVGRGYSEGDFIMSFCSDNPNTTKVSVYASTASPYCTFVLETDSTDCPLVPPVDGCDLNINSVDTTNETSTGANDGTATINASSTHGPITFSLDGVTYVSSGVFIGLSPGNYTGYAKDADECLQSINFSIVAYLNPIQNFDDNLPTVPVATGNISKWNAAYNPIVINFQRKDFLVISITRASDSQIAVTLSTTLLTNQYQLGLNDTLYLKTAKYEYQGKASSFSNVSGNGVFIIDKTYTEDDTTGFLNINGIKPGYYIDLIIQYGLDPVNPQFINPTFSQNSKGAVRADLSPFLQTLLDFKDNYNYTDASYTDLSQSASYQVKFRELWSGGNGQWFSAPYPLYVARAAMQLGEKNNGNMAQYVPFVDATNSYDKAKFLTNFKQPVYWQGLPFEISFIYSEDLINQALFLELVPDCGEEPGDILLENADAGLITDTDTSKFIIARTDISSIPVLQALGVNRLLIPDVFDCCASKIVANIYFLVDSVKHYVMHPLTIRTICKCSEPYVYLKWVNSLGAWDYYYFGYNQTLSANISNDQSVKRFVLNWENDDTIEDNISKSSVSSLVVGADGISDDDAQALQWARKSIKAMMLVSTNPVKWRTVIIKDGTTNVIQSRKRISSVQMELLLPSDNIQNQ